jgi:hypothetical protein
MALGLAKPPLPRRSGGFGGSGSEQSGLAPVGWLPWVPTPKRRSAITSTMNRLRSMAERWMEARNAWSETWLPWRQSRAPPQKGGE